MALRSATLRPSTRVNAHDARFATRIYPPSLVSPLRPHSDSSLRPTLLRVLFPLSLLPPRAIVWYKRKSGKRRGEMARCVSTRMCVCMRVTAQRSRVQSRRGYVRDRRLIKGKRSKRRTGPLSSYAPKRGILPGASGIRRADRL